MERLKKVLGLLPESEGQVLVLDCLVCRIRSAATTRELLAIHHARMLEGLLFM